MDDLGRHIDYWIIQNTIIDTFALKDVPREALYVGLAGVLPYLATSLSTVYLAWDINYAWNYGEGFLLSGPTAEALLHLIEPIQLGYGASVCSPIYNVGTYLTLCRLSPFSVQFTGDSNGPALAGTKATGATPSAWWPPQSLGRPYFSQPKWD